MKLSNLFKSPLEAYCGMSTVNEYIPPTTPDVENSDSSISVHHVTPSLPSSGVITREDSLMDSFRLLPPEDANTFVGEALSLVASRQFSIDVPKQFAEFALKGKQKLQAAGRSNVIYGLCRGLSLCRSDDPHDTLFPISRMPMGLLEYMVEFFNSEAAHTVSHNNYVLY